MPDREKVIKGIQECDLNGGLIGNCPYKGIIDLLKEQDDLGTELTNAVELILKKNERIEKLLKEQEKQKFFVDENGKITPLPVVVWCKDCKHWTKALGGQCNTFTVNGIAHCTSPEWFCADGERKDG